MDALTDEALALLRMDGRLSYTELGRRLGATRAAVAARIAPLIDRGELRIVAAVHPRLLGLDIMAHLAITVEGDLAQVAQHMMVDTPAVFVSESVGPHHLTAEVHLPDLSALQRVLRTVRGLPGVVDVQHLLYERVLNSFFLGSEPTGTSPDLDTADTVLIGVLQQDGRATFATLSEATGLSITAVRARMGRLIDSGIMRIGALGQRSQSGGNLVFGLGVRLDDDGTRAIELIGARRGLEFMARTVGRYDLVATAPFTTTGQLMDFLDALRDTPGVRGVTAWMHARIRQERYQEAANAAVRARVG